MANKSKAVMKEQKVINPDYNEALSDLIDSCNRMFQTTSNRQSELFRISSIVSLFARQIAYLDALREEASVYKKNCDLQGLNSVIFRLESNYEAKAYDDFWSTLSQMYDNMILETTNESTAESAVSTFKTAEEILEGCRKYYQEQKERQVNDKVKTLEAILQL